MDYKSTLEYLYARLPMYQRVGAVAYKKDLTNTIALCEALGNPQDAFKSIHIAGTNGKGSVSSMTASILQEAGYKVGLYTSPHLKSFTERIRVNGQEITEAAVVQFVQANKELMESVQPSFFEATVAMAFWYFREMKVDVAVVEVGMGGRLDSTNIIKPEACGITNISMDHAQHLGDTLPLIAGEKAGIIKTGIPCVIGHAESEVADVFRKKAQSVGAELFFAEDIYQCKPLSRKLSEQVFEVKRGNAVIYPQLVSPLTGVYQAENTQTVLQLVDVMRMVGFEIPEKSVLDGIRNILKNSGLAGRMTLLGMEPVILTDVGHNEAGIEMVVRQIAEIPHQKLHMVIGVVNDKDVSKMLKLMPPSATYYFVRPDVPRGLDANLLAAQARVIGLKGNVYSSVQEGLTHAKQAAAKEDLIFVGGSSFVVAEVV